MAWKTPGSRAGLGLVDRAPWAQRTHGQTQHSTTVTARPQAHNHPASGTHHPGSAASLPNPALAAGVHGPTRQSQIRGPEAQRSKGPESPGWAGTRNGMQAPWHSNPRRRASSGLLEVGGPRAEKQSSPLEAAVQTHGVVGMEGRAKQRSLWDQRPK